MRSAIQDVFLLSKRGRLDPPVTEPAILRSQAQLGSQESAPCTALGACHLGETPDTKRRRVVSGGGGGGEAAAIAFCPTDAPMPQRRKQASRKVQAVCSCLPLEPPPLERLPPRRRRRCTHVQIDRPPPLAMEGSFLYSNPLYTSPGDEDLFCSHENSGVLGNGGGHSPLAARIPSACVDGGLLPAFLQQLSSPLLLSALATMERCDLHPVAEDYFAPGLEYTCGGAVLGAGRWVLGAGLQAHPRCGHNAAHHLQTQPAWLPIRGCPRAPNCPHLAARPVCLLHLPLPQACWCYAAAAASATRS